MKFETDPDMPRDRVTLVSGRHAVHIVNIGESPVTISDEPPAEAPSPSVGKSAYCAIRDHDRCTNPHCACECHK